MRKCKRISTLFHFLFCARNFITISRKHNYFLQSILFFMTNITYTRWTGTLARKKTHTHTKKEEENSETIFKMVSLHLSTPFSFSRPQYLPYMIFGGTGDDPVLRGAIIEINKIIMTHLGHWWAVFCGYYEERL